jgi:hypothetical protein
VRCTRRVPARPEPTLHGVAHDGLTLLFTLDQGKSELGTVLLPGALAVSALGLTALNLLTGTCSSPRR